MRSYRSSLAVVVVLALATTSARADEVAQFAGTTDTYVAKPEWSVIGPQTVAPGRNMLSFGIGWPGIDLSYYVGLIPDLNVGIHAGLRWAFQGKVDEVGLGLQPQLAVKWMAYHNDRVWIGLNAEIGPGFYFSNPTGYGLSMPIGLAVGVAITKRVAATATLDFPLYFSFGGPQSMPQPFRISMPILLGGGLEYFIWNNFLIFGRAKLGPSLDWVGSAPNGWTSRVGFSWELSMGVGYRF